MSKEKKVIHIKAKYRKFVELLVGGMDKEDAMREAIPESVNWSKNTWNIMRSQIMRRNGVAEYYKLLMKRRDKEVAKTVAKEVAKEVKWSRDKATEILLKALNVLSSDFDEQAKAAKSTEGYNYNANKAKIDKRNDTARTLRDLAAELNKMYQFDKRPIEDEMNKPVTFEGEDQLQEYDYNADENANETDDLKIDNLENENIEDN